MNGYLTTCSTGPELVGYVDAYMDVSGIYKRVWALSDCRLRGMFLIMLIPNTHTDDPRVT